MVQIAPRDVWSFNIFVRVSENRTKHLMHMEYAWADHFEGWLRILSEYIDLNLNKQLNILVWCHSLSVMYETTLMS